MKPSIFLCSFDRASLYNLVNKTNLVHNLFFYIYQPLHVSDDYGSIIIHSILHTRHSSTQNNKYQVSHKHTCFSWWCTHSRPKHVETDKYTKNKTTENKLCTKLALFTRPLPVSMPDCGRKFDTYQSQKELFCLAPRSSTRSLEDTKQKSLDISIFHYNTPIQ